jgi:hypothetical protein
LITAEFDTEEKIDADPCLNDASRHTAILDVSKYPDDVEVP